MPALTTPLAMATPKLPRDHRQARGFYGPNFDRLAV